MAEDLGEKTEDATPKRIQEAREEGNVSKSTDLASALMLLGLTVLLWLAFMPMLGGMKVMLEDLLGGGVGAELTRADGAPELAAKAVAWGARIGIPVAVALWGLAYLSQFWQVGWLFSTKPLEPKLSKLDPISGFKRIFGISGVVKAGMDSSKVGIVMAVSVLTIIQMFPTIVMLSQRGLMDALATIGWLMFDLACRVVAVLVLLGLLDYLYQRWKHSHDMRMSKTEVKEEMKETEGDPETKKRRMRIQQQVAMQRISAAVPKADVIITNPEHISIAIAYDQTNMGAPKVVAKGQDHLALRIRQIALKHGIPIVERKPLARAMYRQVEVGQEIPADFYQAIAEILAYVYRLTGRMAG